ncbi:MAG: efflux RND transporter periplasmic adaptor subunit [Hespellia sp.]|nr:efflux RND transporter periplasmic adaptor subunit [Hespellia sp.]
MFNKKGKPENQEDIAKKNEVEPENVKDHKELENPDEKETGSLENGIDEEQTDLGMDDPDELDAAAAKPKKKLPNWVIIVVIAVLVGASVIGSKAFGGGSKKDTSTALNVIKVEKGNVKETINTSGTVQSDTTKIVYSPVNAKVIVSNVKVGKAVKAGDKLIQFDTTTLEQDNQQSQLSLQAANQSNQEAYDAANKAASAQIKAANEAAQSACDAANQLADAVDAQGVAVNQAWSDYNNAVTALDDAESSVLSDEQKQQLDKDKDELYGTKIPNDPEGKRNQDGWKNEKNGVYTEKYNLLDAKIVAADDAVQAARFDKASSQTDIEQKEKDLAEAKRIKDETDARIKELEAEIASIEGLISGQIAAAQATSDAVYAKAQAEQATYDAMYSQWESAYQAAQNVNGNVDTSSTGVTASQKTQMEMSSNAAELAAMTAQQLVEAGRAGLSADFDGVISEVSAAVGTQATQGAPMYTVVDMNHLNVQLEVSTNDYGKYQVGKTASIKIGSNTYDGIVSNVNAMATSNVKGNPVVIVNVKINNPDGNIVIGGTAKVSMNVAEAKNVICVPTEVINTSASGEFVYMIENGKVKKVPVTVGVASDTKVEVTEGLSEGNQVVSDTVADITEGMDATPAETSSK